MSKLNIDDGRLQQVREICLALPEATEKEAWGDPTWRVNDKIFTMSKGNYGDHRPSLWMKVPGELRPVLLDAGPERFFIPPYVGHKGWVGIYMDTDDIDWSEVASLVEESYRLIAPRKLAGLV